MPKAREAEEETEMQVKEDSKENASGVERWDTEQTKAARRQRTSEAMI